MKKVLIRKLAAKWFKVVSLMKNKWSVFTNGVWEKSSGDGNSPSKEEGSSNSSISSQKHRLKGIVQTEVHSSKLIENSIKFPFYPAVCQVRADGVRRKQSKSPQDKHDVSLSG